MTTTVFISLLNNTFQVGRLVRTPNGQGGWAETYASAGTVLGRMRPASSTEREAAMLEERQISHVLYVLAGSDVVRGDVVSLDGFSVEVMGIREPSLAAEHLEIDCLERQLQESLEGS